MINIDRQMMCMTGSAQAAQPSTFRILPPPHTSLTTPLYRAPAPSTLHATRIRLQFMLADKMGFALAFPMAAMAVRRSDLDIVIL